MLLSRKRLYRIKKTKRQSRRRRKNRNKKKYRKKRRAGSRRKRRALNLRKRTMKSYRGGVRKKNLSFFFPNREGNLMLVTATSNPIWNRNLPDQAQETYRDLFVDLACHISDKFIMTTPLFPMRDGLDRPSFKNMLLAISINIGDTSPAFNNQLPESFKKLFFNPMPFRLPGNLSPENIMKLNRDLFRSQVGDNPFLVGEEKKSVNEIESARRTLIETIASAQREFLRRQEEGIPQDSEKDHDLVS